MRGAYGNDSPRLSALVPAKLSVLWGYGWTFCRTFDSDEPGEPLVTPPSRFFRQPDPGRRRGRDVS